MLASRRRFDVGAVGLVRRDGIPIDPDLDRRIRHREIVDGPAIGQVELRAIELDDDVLEPAAARVVPNVFVEANAAQARQSEAPVGLRFGLQVGDPITLTLQQYSRLSNAFFREIEAKFSRPDADE